MLVGCVHASQQAGNPAPLPAASSVAAVPGEKAVSGTAELDYQEEGNGEEPAAIADPLEPFNRAMFQVNDKLYFWVFKPVAKGYGKVVPELARVGVRNFFSNLAFPIRFVNCLLQAQFTGAATELGRFVVNTIWGIGGFRDLASNEDINLKKQEGDFGQTLGKYGVGQGFFITWPFLGPSSARDTVGMVGDGFLQPLNYLTPSDAALGAKVYEKVNSTSLSLGDYESLKDAAIDPYVAFRDAYVQYRLNKVNNKTSTAGSSESSPTALPAAATPGSLP
jgi:phospholipid-binding lipoprotein MlaA